MRILTFIFLATLFFLGCQSAEEQTGKSDSEEKFQKYISRKSNESTIEFAKRAWADFCEFPSSNKELIFNKKEYIFSYCGKGDETEWYQYLLLERKGSTNNHKKLVFEKRKQVSELEKYYGFPAFVPTIVRGIDLNGDKQEELLIQIHVGGPSSGAGAEEQTYWDEDFYEVYELENDAFAFSKSLTAQYKKSLNSHQKSFDVSDNEGITNYLQPITGEYFAAKLIDGQAHWKECYGKRLEVSIKDDGAEVWVDHGMDGFPLKINRIRGNGKGVMDITCQRPIDYGGDEDKQEELSYQVKEKVHILTWGEDQYILLADKGKIPFNPEKCEDADEGS